MESRKSDISRPSDTGAPSTSPLASIPCSESLTPNLIARGDRALERLDSTVRQTHLVDNLRSWSAPSAFDTPFQQIPPGIFGRDRFRSYPTYAPPMHLGYPQQGYWPQMDARYLQRVSTAPAPNAPNGHGHAQPSQYGGDARIQYFQQDFNYYQTGMQPGPGYGFQPAMYNYDRPSRYRQATYPFVTSSQMPYAQAQRASGPIPSSLHLMPADYPQLYAGQAVPFPNANVSGQYHQTCAGHHESGTGQITTEPTPSYPRGPPRKPKQSGFAVWVGNLSPGTTILNLKDYFSRGATKDIESVFLISKSNCAFVNYKTAESAQAAVARFHDSRFNGARIVCRLRHGQAPTVAAPTNTVDETTQPSPSRTGDGVSTKARGIPSEPGNCSIGRSGEVQSVNGPIGHGKDRVPERYFIVKSLTLQDLEASVRDGIWATQSHNENVLKEAYESAQHVYLIFSANKSGEYFGYARMKSNINPSGVTINPRADSSAPAPSDGPASIPTPATEDAPKGRVVDDSARGSIFWEADTPSETELEDHEDVNAAEGEERDSSPDKISPRRKTVSRAFEETTKQDWGKPFQIEWLSTSRLPFYRTRGIRNPWNANREVKIARDGTELEPSVGRRLLDLFHQPVLNSSATTSIPYQMPEGPVVVVGSNYPGPKTQVPL
ncbi:hypothetical protein CAC42_3092 [Sphaceloma murrayae]|uniref:YTH domain-containing protein n=1 Tax=Sphaceloma murrayae TaxID=2082308 RepID=A0A2K1QRI4_9PEZI|nr:hypothetical protein CAC42_3092 [Sphaceloma murrayae]